VYWRDAEIAGHAAWRARIARKDDQPGRSAPTLAAAWCGPLELLAALSRQPALADLQIESLNVEAQTAFDRYPGGRRTHDLLILGRAAGGRVLVSVEAKAGETLGPTVGEYRRAGEKRQARNEPTNAPERLDALLKRFVRHHDPRSERVVTLRYQLLTAVAGTIAAADASVGCHSPWRNILSSTHQTESPRPPKSSAKKICWTTNTISAPPATPATVQFSKSE
jgi:hypothetical protein